MIVKTRAVVLRELKYRDQSKICLLMTREFGQLSVILKAGRNPKSKLSGLFTVGNIVDAVIYKRSTRDIQLASDASLVLSPLSQMPDLDRFGVLYRVLDLARHSSGQEEKNLPLFTLLSSTIEQLCAEEKNFMPLLARFLLRLVGLLGFAPSIDRCVFSGQDLLCSIDDIRELYFVHDPGGFALSESAASYGVQMHKVPASQYLLIREIATKGFSVESASPQEVEAVCDLLQEYCAKHLERMPNRKHLAVVSRIMTA